MSWQRDPSVLAEIGALVIYALGGTALLIALTHMFGCTATQRRNVRTVIHVADGACVLVESAIPNGEAVCLTVSELREVADVLLARRKMQALLDEVEIVDGGADGARLRVQTGRRGVRPPGGAEAFRRVAHCHPRCPLCPDPSGDSGPGAE